MAQDGGIFDVEVLQKVLCDPSNGIITTPPPLCMFFITFPIFSVGKSRDFMFVNRMTRRS